jgi:hypothetical protein
VIPARQRLATEGWTASDWVATALRTALLPDGGRLLESMLKDLPLLLPNNASRPGEKRTAVGTRH